MTTHCSCYTKTNYGIGIYNAKNWICIDMYIPLNDVTLQAKTIFNPIVESVCVPKTKIDLLVTVCDLISM